MWPTHLTYKRDQLHVDLYPHFLTSEEAAFVLTDMEAKVQWTRPRSNGRRCQQNYGDPGATYTVDFGRGKVTRQTIPWDAWPMSSALRDRLQLVLNRDNGRPDNDTWGRCIYTVVQGYSNGQVDIKPHRDKEMPPTSLICGLSLGETRVIRFSRGVCSLDLPLPSGSLYVMHPPTNEVWKHSIPKAPSVTGYRYSLTFRTLGD